MRLSILVAVAHPEEGSFNLCMKLHLRHAIFEHEKILASEMAPTQKEIALEEGVALVFSNSEQLVPAVGISVLLASELDQIFMDDIRVGGRMFLRLEF